MTFEHCVIGFRVVVAIFFGLSVIFMSRTRKEIDIYLKQNHTDMFLNMYSPPSHIYDDEHSDVYFDKLIKTEFIKLNDENMPALVSEYKILRASCSILAIVLFLTLIFLR